MLLFLSFLVFSNVLYLIRHLGGSKPGRTRLRLGLLGRIIQKTALLHPAVPRERSIAIAPSPSSATAPPLYVLSLTRSVAVAFGTIATTLLRTLWQRRVETRQFLLVETEALRTVGTLHGIIVFLDPESLRPVGAFLGFFISDGRV